MWLLAVVACVQTDPVLDTAAPPSAPTAAFEWESGCDLAPIIAYSSTSEAAEGDLVQLLWSFGDGTSGFGDLVIHTYAESGPFEVVHTAVDDAGRERTVREEVPAIACLENQGQEVTITDGLASPLALIANVGGAESASVTFLIDLLDDDGAVVIPDVPGSRAVISPDMVVVAKPPDPWPCGEDCDRITGMRVRLEQTYWFPVE